VLGDEELLLNRRCPTQLPHQRIPKIRIQFQLQYQDLLPRSERLPEVGSRYRVRSRDCENGDILIKKQIPHHQHRHLLDVQRSGPPRRNPNQSQKTPMMKLPKQSRRKENLPHA